MKISHLKPTARFLHFALLCSVLSSIPDVNSAEGFKENFSGNGPFQVDGLRGFDTPGWGLNVTSNAKFEDGALRLDSGVILGDNHNTDDITRVIGGVDSFIEKLRIRDLILDPGSAPNMPVLLLFHYIHETPLSFLMVKPAGGPYILDASINRSTAAVTRVEISSNIELTIEYDAESSEVVFGYDNNYLDEIAAETFGPFGFEGVHEGDQRLHMFFGADAPGARATGLLDFWSVEFPNAPIIGDFNGDQVVDIFDIDLLSEEVRAKTNATEFDILNDGIVDDFDRAEWVHNAKRTFFGDSNLDGEFNSSDLVSVFQANEYEDQLDLNSTWATGDWNGDGDFASRDLVFAFGDGGYEVGQRVAAAQVPEPSSFVMLSIAFLMFFRTRTQSEL